MESGLLARNGGRIGIAALAAVLLLGFGLRIGEAWDGRAPVYDATAYAALAANLDRGDGFTVGPTATQPSTDYSPGLPLLVAGVYEISGGVHERLARLLLAALGTLAVLFTYLIARRLRRVVGYPHQGVAIAPLGAALAVAVYPALLEYQGMLMSEPLAATLLSAAILAVLWARDGNALARWALPGALLGALAMVRPEYLGVGALIAVLVAASGLRDRRRSLAAGAIVLAGLVLLVVPWTVRNAVALHRFVPVSTGGGQVLFSGTYLPSGGDPEKVGAGVIAENPGLFGPHALHELRLEQVLARLAEHRHPGMEADTALSKMGKEQLWDDVTEEPLEYIGFLASKVGRIWSHGPRQVMREPLWEALHWALVAFGALGLALLAWRRRWEALLLGTVFLAITAISALLVASPRRVLVMLPLIAALAGVGAAWLGTVVARRTDSLARP